MTDPHLIDVSAELKSLETARSEFYWGNPDAPSAPQDKEIQRFKKLLNDGVSYEPRF